MSERDNDIQRRMREKSALWNKFLDNSDDQCQHDAHAESDEAVEEAERQREFVKEFKRCNYNVNMKESGERNNAAHRQIGIYKKNGADKSRGEIEHLCTDTRNISLV